MKGLVALSPTGPETIRSWVWTPRTTPVGMLLAKAVLLGADKAEAREWADRLGMPERVKTALAPQLTTDHSSTGGLNASRIIATSFQPLLRNSSAFFRCLDLGMMRAPLRQRISYLSSAASGSLVNEGDMIRVSRHEFDNVNLQPVRCAPGLSSSPKNF